MKKDPISCKNCGLTKSTCEMIGGDKWAKNCQAIEGKKHEFEDQLADNEECNHPRCTTCKNCHETGCIFFEVCSTPITELKLDKKKIIDHGKHCSCNNCKAFYKSSTKDTLEAMVRDFTSITPRSKSEVRRRIKEFSANDTKLYKLVQGMKENIQSHHNKFFKDCPRCIEVMAENHALDEVLKLLK